MKPEKVLELQTCESCSEHAAEDTEDALGCWFMQTANLAQNLEPTFLLRYLQNKWMRAMLKITLKLQGFIITINLKNTKGYFPPWSVLSFSSTWSVKGGICEEKKKKKGLLIVVQLEFPWKPKKGLKTFAATSQWNITSPWWQGKKKKNPILSWNLYNP